MTESQEKKLEELEARVAAMRDGFISDFCVRSSRFVLLDEAGNPRAELGPNHHGSTALELRNKEGQTQAVLGVHPSGSPFLLLLGPQGEPRLSAYLDPDGSPTIVLAGSDMKPRIRIAEKDGGSQVALLDGNGTARAALSVLSNGVPAILTFDEKGEISR